MSSENSDIRGWCRLTQKNILWIDARDDLRSNITMSSRQEVGSPLIHIKVNNASDESSTVINGERKLLTKMK